MMRLHWLVPVSCLAVVFVGGVGGETSGTVAFFMAFGAYAGWVAVLLLKGGKERWKTSNLLFICLFIMFPAALVSVALKLWSWDSLELALRSWVVIVLLALMVILGVIQELRNRLVRS